MNPESVGSAVNLSMALLFISFVPLALFLGYIIFNSPIGTPIFRWLGERQFQKKQYAKAAQTYIKLHDLQVQLEGFIYAKKAALSLELSGNLREARRWYEKCEDWAKLGQLSLEAGETDAALEIFAEHGLHARMIQVYELKEQWIAAGDVYQEQLQNAHKAENAYRRASHSEDPETKITAELKLAQLYHQMQREQDARELLQSAQTQLQSSPQFVEFPDLLALHSAVREMIVGA